MVNIPGLSSNMVLPGECHNQFLSVEFGDKAFIVEMKLSKILIEDIFLLILLLIFTWLNKYNMRAMQFLRMRSTEACLV